MLIPNPVFGRDIPPVLWNYPVWIATSILAGVLLATYLRPGGNTPAEGAESVSPDTGAASARRSAPLGGMGGALTWFAPFQPVLPTTLPETMPEPLRWLPHCSNSAHRKPEPCCLPSPHSPIRSYMRLVPTGSGTS